MSECNVMSYDLWHIVFAKPKRQTCLCNVYAWLEKRLMRSFYQILGPIVLTLAVKMVKRLFFQRIIVGHRGTSWPAIKIIAYCACEAPSQFFGYMVWGKSFTAIKVIVSARWSLINIKNPMHLNPIYRVNIPSVIFIPRDSRFTLGF